MQRENFRQPSTADAHCVGKNIQQNSTEKSCTSTSEWLKIQDSVRMVCFILTCSRAEIQLIKKHLRNRSTIPAIVFCWIWNSWTVLEILKRVIDK